MLAKDAGFGSLMRQRRRILNIGTVELADACGLAQSHISRIETGGRRPPALKYCLKMARKLGLKQGSSEFYEFLRAAHRERFPQQEAWLKHLNPSIPSPTGNPVVECGSLAELVLQANEHAIVSKAVEVTVRGPNADAITFQIKAQKGITII